MDSDAALKSIKNDVFREIGKNVIAFQLVENLLKALLGIGRIEGVASELATVRERRMAQTASLTMGGLAGRFADEILRAPNEDSDELHATNQIRISFSFGLESDDAFCGQQKQALKMLVKQRNELIHHFVAKWDWKSVENMRDAVRYLELQSERTEAQRAFLASIYIAFKEGLEVHAAFLNSEEFARHFELLWLQQSRIVSLLYEFAMQSARTDGYASVAGAGTFVHNHARDDVLNMKARYGFAGLLALIVGAELFDVIEEPTTDGVRQLYRVKISRSGI
jgi:hypothetical protein